jgi:hypothetical protein
MLSIKGPTIFAIDRPGAESLRDFIRERLSHFVGNYGPGSVARGSSRSPGAIRHPDPSPVNDPIEDTVICSRDAIEHLASRIERAYLRRNPRWRSFGADQGVWQSAASRLLEASIDSPNLPIDPELFVAVLAPGGSSPDPWTELTQRSAQTRYLKALRQIIGRLARELRAELRLAECRLSGGMGLDDLIADRKDRISALTRYILAFRAGRFDLVFKLQAAAQAQHRSCPLYRQASRTLLPNHAYPYCASEAEHLHFGQDALQFSLN